MYGIVGAAMAVTVPAIIQYLVDLGVFTRVMNLRLKELLRVMWVPIAAATTMGVALWFLKAHIGSVSVLELILLIVAGMIIYGLIGFPYLKRLSTESLGWPRARQVPAENTAS
jgi:putative flippase GtrA